MFCLRNQDITGAKAFFHLFFMSNSGYIKRDDVRGSIFESHFTWQIRSFWWYLFWNIIAFVLMWIYDFRPRL